MRIWKDRMRSRDDGPRRLVKPWIITVSVLGALAVVAVATVIYIANKDSMTLNGHVMVSMMGDRQDYYGKTQLLHREEEEEVTLRNGGRSVSLSGVPVYCMDTDEVVLSRKMIYSNYDTDVFGRVNHFARVSYKDSIVRIQTGGRNTREFNGGYLFDGKNTYLFLEPVRIFWGENSWEMEPLSYISVFNKQGYYYYSHGDGQMEYVASGDEIVRAEALSGRYVLNMSNDIVDLDNGKSLLLAPSPDSFELLK